MCFMLQKYATRLSQSTGKIVVFTHVLLPVMNVILRRKINVNYQKNSKMKSVEIIMTPVKDRQKAKEFYVKFGFQVLIEATDPHGEAWIQLGLPNGGATISLADFCGRHL